MGKDAFNSQWLREVTEFIRGMYLHQVCLACHMWSMIFEWCFIAYSKYYLENVGFIKVFVALNSLLWWAGGKKKKRQITHDGFCDFLILVINAGGDICSLRQYRTNSSTGCWQGWMTAQNPKVILKSLRTMPCRNTLFL